MSVKLDVELGEFKEEELSERFGEIKDDWADSLARKVQKVYKNLTAVIPDEQAYIEKLAIPSYTNFAGFVNPYHPKAQDAILKQRFGVLAGAKEFVTNVYYSIGLDERFTDGVMDAKDKFEERVKLIWRITGDSDKQVGLLQKLAMALRGDIAKLRTHLSSIDNVNVIEPDCPPMFAPEHLSMCVSAITVKFTALYKRARLIIKAGGDPTDVFSEFANFANMLLSMFNHPNVDVSNSWVIMDYNSADDRIIAQVHIETIS